MGKAFDLKVTKPGVCGIACNREGRQFAAACG